MTDHVSLNSSATLLSLYIEISWAKRYNIYAIWSHGAKIHEKRVKSATFLFIMTVLTNGSPKEWVYKGFLACRNRIWSLFVSKAERFFRKKTFHFLTIDPWWKNVNFSLCKSIIGMILVFQMLTNKYRKKLKKYISKISWQIKILLTS